MSTETKKPATHVTTGLVRLSYAKIWKPEAVSDADGAEKKYSTAVLIDKADEATLEKINAAVEQAKQDGKTKKWGGKIPAKLKLPLRDGDDEKPDMTEYADHFFLNASNKDKPVIIDRFKEPITDESKVYSGCYARVMLNFYPFDANGNRGVGVSLEAIQFVKDGERLAGSVVDVNEFDDGFDYDEAEGGEDLI